MSKFIATKKFGFYDKKGKGMAITWVLKGIEVSPELAKTRGLLESGFVARVA